MRNKTTWYERLSLISLLLFLVLFSAIKIQFEHRALSVVYDSRVTADDGIFHYDSTASRIDFAGQTEPSISSSSDFAQTTEPSISLSRDFARTIEPSELSSSGDNDSTSLMCHKIVGKTESSFQRVWEAMKPSIMKVSLINTDWTKDIRSIKNFTDWLDESMSYFTYSRLQHTSISRPIDQTRSVGRIHSILEAKLRNPDTAPPLRIVVFGGSVTNGHYCLDNIFDFLVRNDGKGNDRAGTPAHQSKLCAWSGRLQDMVDAVFGRGVVEIKNLAVGGAKSDMSTALMEFGLIPGSTPDIIVWDHGINDSMTTVNPNVKFFESSGLDTEQIFEKLQRFYQAVVALPTSCDNPDPPLVIMLDSLIGQQSRFPRISEALRTSAATTKMVTWYPDIWGISYANTVRPYVLSKVNNQKKMIGLLGSNGVTTHPGMMYHISIAWIVLFNLLNALHDNCITQEIENTIISREGSSTADTNTSNEYFKLSHLPELHEDVRMLDIPQIWNDRVPESLEYHVCIEKQNAITAATKKFTKHSSLTCYYAWMVNNVLKVETPQQVFRVIKPYIVNNEGWSAFGTEPTVKPGGWIPLGGQGSYFDLQFNDVPITVNSLTIIYMQSYSAMWINSTLEVDGIFLHPSVDVNNKDSIVLPEIESISDNNNNITSGTIQRTEMYSIIRYHISGYHDEETSILVPMKLQLPDRTLEEGKTILRLQFRLLHGQTFKIAGMALC